MALFTKRKSATLALVREKTQLVYFSETPTRQSGVEVTLIIVTAVVGIVLIAWAGFETQRRPYWMPGEIVRGMRFVMAALGIGWIACAGTLAYRFQRARKRPDARRLQPRRGGRM